MLTDYLLLDWTFEQWVIAFAERGVDRYDTTKLWTAAYREEMSWRGSRGQQPWSGNTMERFIDCQHDWWKRHAFPPGKSPIVVPDAYRVREAC